LQAFDIGGFGEDMHGRGFGCKGKVFSRTLKGAPFVPFPIDGKGTEKI
jgi:hypothetical protein